MGFAIVNILSIFLLFYSHFGYILVKNDVMGLSFVFNIIVWNKHDNIVYDRIFMLIVDFGCCIYIIELKVMLS